MGPQLVSYNLIGIRSGLLDTFLQTGIRVRESCAESEKIHINILLMQRL